MAQPTLAGRIVAAMESKGYRVDRGPGEVNIVYVRGMDANGEANANTPNSFNDLRIVLGFLGGEPKILRSWPATVEPGKRYVLGRINPKGAAYIIDGQQRAWRVGIHRGHHEALIQTGGPVTVTRDDNEDFNREGDPQDTGWFGINQHGGYDQPLGDIGGASAGCLVTPSMDEHAEFMALVKKDPRYQADHDYTFATTVLPASDVLADVQAPPLVPALERVTAEQRLRMAKHIVGFEARRDKQGRLAVYRLPAGDGGGRYEVAGINERYHPQKAAELAALIEAGLYAEAEVAIADYLLDYTDVCVSWYGPGDPGVEFFLRDCVFNRGPTGAARILQRALMEGLGEQLIGGEDGIVGPSTKEAAARHDARSLITALRAARESYERSPVGRDEGSKFWRGLVNRWNSAEAAAERFTSEAPAPVPIPAPEPGEPVPAPPLPPAPAPDQPELPFPPSSPELDALKRKLMAALEPVLREYVEREEEEDREMAELAKKIDALSDDIRSLVTTLQGGRAGGVPPGFTTISPALVTAARDAARAAAPSLLPVLMPLVAKVLPAFGVYGSIAGVVLTWIAQAHGYVDPGTGATATTALTGAGVAAAVAKVGQWITKIAEAQQPK